MTTLRLQTAFIIIELLATPPTLNKFNCIYYVSLDYRVMYGMIFCYMIVVEVVLTNTTNICILPQC